MSVFTFSDEERQLQTTVRSFLAEFVDNEYLNAQEESETGYEAARWASICELGWTGAHLPDRAGGADGTLVDAALIAREAGRAAYASPLLSTLRAATAADALGTDKAYDDVLSGIAGGEIAALVAPPDRPVVAEPADAGFRLRGGPVVVEWLAQADWAICVLPTTATDWIATAVPAEELRGRASDVSSIDNERMVSLDLAGLILAEASVRTPRLQASDAAYALARADLLRASAMVGGAQDVVERTATYVVERHQFGQPLGKFQAVRQHAARMVIAADGAELLCDDALSRIDSGPAETAIAKAAVFAAGRAYVDVVLTAAQLHGGVGTTVEHILHHHFRRAKAMQLRSGKRAARARELHEALVVRGEAAEGSLW